MKWHNFELGLKDLLFAPTRDSISGRDLGQLVRTEIKNKGWRWFVSATPKAPSDLGQNTKDTDSIDTIILEVDRPNSPPLLYALAGARVDPIYTEGVLKLDPGFYKSPDLYGGVALVAVLRRAEPVNGQVDPRLHKVVERVLANSLMAAVKPKSTSLVSNAISALAVGTNLPEEDQPYFIRVGYSFPVHEKSDSSVTVYFTGSGIAEVLGKAWNTYDRKGNLIVQRDFYDGDHTLVFLNKPYIVEALPLDSWLKDVSDWRRDWANSGQRIIGLRILYDDGDGWKPVTVDDPKRGFLLPGLDVAMDRYKPNLVLKKAVVETSSSGVLPAVNPDTNSTTTQLLRSSL